jgi:hypothetical protein
MPWAVTSLAHLADQLVLAAIWRHRDLRLLNRKIGGNRLHLAAVGDSGIARKLLGSRYQKIRSACGPKVICPPHKVAPGKIGCRHMPDLSNTGFVGQPQHLRRVKKLMNGEIPISGLLFQGLAKHVMFAPFSAAVRASIA